MIYFTSDLHLGHKAVIEMNNRPFADIEEMNKVLIDNINTRVKQNDTLYILGDLSFRIPLSEANRLIQQIQCKNKYLLIGNHDKNYDSSLFKGMYDFKKVNMISKNEINYDISLMHYPMLEWPRSRHGSVHFHGHIHSRGSAYNQQMKSEGIRRYDVGVDANNYKPISLDEILSFMEVESEESAEK